LDQFKGIVVVSASFIPVPLDVDVEKPWGAWRSFLGCLGAFENANSASPEVLVHLHVMVNRNALLGLLFSRLLPRFLGHEPPPLAMVLYGTLSMADHTDIQQPKELMLNLKC
jgi:hypothetical protein